MSNMQSLLVVDDDPGIRNQLKWGIEGYTIYVAKNRKDALEAFSEYLPGVVTLDLGLPPDSDGVSEGFKILKEILQKAPKTRVIVVSGSDAKQNAPKAVSSGAFDYVAKPFNLELLNQKINMAYEEYRLNT